MNGWMRECLWMNEKQTGQQINKQINKQTNKQTKPLYEDAYGAYDTVGLGYNPGKLTKCKWFW